MLKIIKVSKEVYAEIKEIMDNKEAWENVFLMFQGLDNEKYLIAHGLKNGLISMGRYKYLNTYFSYRTISMIYDFCAEHNLIEYGENFNLLCCYGGNALKIDEHIHVDIFNTTESETCITVCKAFKSDNYYVVVNSTESLSSRLKAKMAILTLK